MKQCFSVISMLLLSINLLSSQTNNNSSNKDILKIIHSAYECWSAGSNDSYSEPDDYIYDKKTKEVIGQKLIYLPYNKKYQVIMLDNSKKPIENATFYSYPNTFNVSLTWNGNRLVGLKINMLDKFDYTIDYNKSNNQVIGFSNKDVFRENRRLVTRMEYNNNLISKITKYYYAPSTVEPEIGCVKTFSHKDSVTLVNSTVYLWKKSQITKNTSSYQSTYITGKDNCYSIINSYNTKTFKYNNNGDIERKVITSKERTEKHIYAYIGHKLYKEETEIKGLNGQFIEKSIRIWITPQNANVPDYEKTEGIYKFDANGDLIYEYKDSDRSYRNKVNGTWSEWRSAEY
jgi:hypothetical protein